MSRFRIIFSIFLITIALFTIHADSNGIWTYPRDVTPGVFGEDESSNPNENYTFNNVVYFNERTTFNGLITANDIFYSTSNIGIGVINPTNRLEVSGNIESNQLIDSNDNSYLVNPNGVSNMYRIVADAYFSPGSTAYYVNPSGTSRVGVVNANTLQIGGQHTDNRYVNEGQANSISNSMLQNNAVTSAKILDNSITSSDILDGTITSADLGDNSVGSREIATNSVGADELSSAYQSGSAYDGRFVNEGQTNSISNNMLQNNVVTSEKIANKAVGGNQLEDSYSSGSAYDNRFIKIGEVAEVGENSVGSIELREEYSSGSAYDDRFVNEGQTNSIDSNMVIDGTLGLVDVNQREFDSRYATIQFVQENINNYLNFRSYWFEGSCPSDWVDTELTDCDSGDGHSVQEDSCGNGGGERRLCLKLDLELIPEGSLFNGIHTENECTSLGGQMVTDSSSNKFCRFSRNSCPAGWYRFELWSTATSVFCPAGDRNDCAGYSGRPTPSSCSSPSKVWSNSPVGSCSSTYVYEYDETRGGDPKCNSGTFETCTSEITQIGCY